LNRIKISFLLLALTLASGISGFHFIEGMHPFDALYMTVITISTVGFEEVKPLSTQGRIIAMLLISCGITIGAYTIGNILRMFIEGEFARRFGRRKVEKKIASMKDHYIICGYGRIGRLICEELKKHGKQFVVIENDSSMHDIMTADSILFLPSDATNEEVLMQAGLMKAKALVTAVKSDADNVFIILTARGFRNDIFVLSRASDEKNEGKMRRAGASRVVSPYLIGGQRMAQVLIRPTVVDFIDIAVMDSNIGLLMEEIKVSRGSRLVGKNLMESNLRRDFGVIIVLIKKHNGDMIFNPQSGEVLEAEDLLVVLGKKDDLALMEKSV
jgi:voltage-gated potassium channel